MVLIVMVVMVLMVMVVVVIDGCDGGDGDDDKENGVLKCCEPVGIHVPVFWQKKIFLPPTYGNTLQLFHNNKNMECGNELFEGKQI